MYVCCGWLINPIICIMCICVWYYFYGLPYVFMLFHHLKSIIWFSKKYLTEKHMEKHISNLQWFCDSKLAQFKEYLWITICNCMLMHMVIHNATWSCIWMILFMHYQKYLCITICFCIILHMVKHIRWWKCIYMYFHINLWIFIWFSK